MAVWSWSQSVLLKSISVEMLGVSLKVLANVLLELPWLLLLLVLKLLYASELALELGLLVVVLIEALLMLVLLF